MKKILLYIYEHYKESHFQSMAASLSFISTLSLVPLLGICITFFSFTGQLQDVYSQVEPIILKYFATSASQDVLNVINTILIQLHGIDISVTAFIGFFITSSSLIAEIDHSFQKIWLKKRNQIFWVRVLIYWSIIFFFPIAVVYFLSLLVNQNLFETIPIGWVANVCFAVLLYTGYRFLPPVKIKNRVAIISAFATMLVLWLSKKMYFGLMISLMQSQKVYGSFVSVPIFLVYIYLLWVILLMGAILCAGLQKGFED